WVEGEPVAPLNVATEEAPMEPEVVITRKVDPAPTEQPPEARAGVKGLRESVLTRKASILRAIQDGRQTATEILDATGIPRGSFHGSMNKLIFEGLVMKDETTVPFRFLPARGARPGVGGRNDAPTAIAARSLAAPKASTWRLDDVPPRAHVPAPAEPLGDIPWSASHDGARFEDASPAEARVIERDIVKYYAGDFRPRAPQASHDVQRAGSSE
ncbi:MAG: helix-turn-helix domain-containing protein, partial [Rhodospirillum sp.]|nr:helix-turn-helix domain-containing protein [Rhodospirillum sp.]